MSCNCGCGGTTTCMTCNQASIKCRCSLRQAPSRAYIDNTCSDCDPCIPRKSLMKICSFVVPTLEEGKKFRDAFIFNQEDDAVYYITDDGSEIPFGARPMFIHGFTPEDKVIPRQMVFDFTNNKGYVFDPEGNYRTITLGE